MKNERIIYECDGLKMQGAIYYEASHGKKPCVLVVHAWMGQDDFARKKAKNLAKLGYVGFAVDLYGNAKNAHSVDEAVGLMGPLFMDRELIQKRLKAAFEVAKCHPEVDAAKMGGIGFCFGGLSIIELFRSGVDLKGVVSFHAVLGNEKEGKRAKTVPIAKNIKGSLLILHGYDDPLVTPQDIDRVQKELTEANVDWQMHIYGHTSHAFTNPEANDTKMGLIYNQKAEKRSWQAMKNFFEEIFT